MKKSKTKSKKISGKDITPDLPQNIVPIGERVYEDKNIYIHQKVYDQIHKFSQSKTENEHGGILVGRVLNEMGKENTIIEGFIEAKYNSATPTTLTFTHETWEHFHSEIGRKYKDKKIVGWIHTHPNFGIFLSENDRFIQENFFKDTNQIAYVVDPIQKDEGFFFWIGEKLERCPGFYLFDKNGVRIKQKIWNAEDASDDIAIEPDRKINVWAIVLSVLLVVNLLASLMQASRIKKLEKQIDDQNIVLQYCLLAPRGIPDVSFMADNIRMQIEMQNKANQQVSQSETNQSVKSDAAKTEESGEKNPEQGTENNNETPEETGDNGGNE